MNDARWSPAPTAARVVAVLAAVAFGVAAFTLIGTNAADATSIFNPLLHGLGFLSAGLTGLSVYAAVRPFPEHGRDIIRGKGCKFCLEAMQAYATRCPHCGAEQS